MLSSIRQPKSPNEITYYSLDIQDNLSCKDCCEKVLKSHEQIDVLINAAGIAILGGSEISPEEFHKQISVNLMGTYHFIYYLLPSMKQQNRGYIINIVSRAGKMGIRNLVGYSASKFGLYGLTESLYKELLATNIHCTNLCPGLVDTEMTQFSTVDNSLKIPSEDIAKGVKFLLSLSPQSNVLDLTIGCRENERRDLFKD